MFKKIYIEITNVCNLKCKFCPESKRKKRFITVEEFENVVSKIHDYTNLVCLHVKGEPLLHLQLKEILNILEKYNLKANITTNGILIKQNINILKNSKAVRQINFSLHSLTENENIKINYLKYIFESADELSNNIISYRMWNLSNLKENDKNNVIIKEIENHYNKTNLKEELQNNEYIKLKENVFINQDIEFTWPDVRKQEIIQEGRCLAIKEQIAVLVDGTVVPCCLDNDGEIVLGNIFKEELQEILNKPKTQEILENFKENTITCKLCKTCGFLKRLENKRKR